MQEEQSNRRPSRAIIAKYRNGWKKNLCHGTVLLILLLILVQVFLFILVRARTLLPSGSNADSLKTKDGQYNLHFRLQPTALYDFPQYLLNGFVRIRYDMYMLTHGEWHSAISLSNLSRTLNFE